MKKLNFAIIGCGRISYKHLKALSEMNQHATLVAVCDIDEVKAKAKSQQYNVPYYTNYHEMLTKHTEIDVVNVLVPSGYHAKVVIEIAQYKCNIITEKPMALTVSDCKAMISECEKFGVQLFVIYQNRYNQAIIKAKEAFDQGKLGDISLATVRVRWSRNQEYYEMDNWHGTWLLDGGVISQQATHHLDLLQYFCGEIDSVNCQIATRQLNIEVEDTAGAVIRFKSGALGIFEATVATRPKDLEGSLSLLGAKGNIIVGGIAVNEITSWEVNDEINETLDSEEVQNVYGNGHTQNIKEIVDLIRFEKKSQLICTAQQGMKNIEVLTALYESAFSQGAMKVPGTESLLSPLGKNVVKK